MNASAGNRGLLLENTLLNVGGQLVPMLVALATIPYIIHRLGTERFGVLSLALVVLNCFSLFDMGLGRATTKFVAEALGKDEISSVPRILWSSLALHASLGLLGGGTLVVIATPLVTRVFHIPAAIQAESRATFLILAACVPIVVVTSSLRGALEAGQRFDLVNLIKLPSNALTYGVPAAALPFGVHLPGIVLLITVSRAFALLAYLLLCFKALPLRQSVWADGSLIRPLLIFGGWVSASGAALSAIISLDRFLIGSILTVSAVSYYAAPYEMVTRLWFLPISLSMALFPAFSSLGGARNGELGRLYASALKYLLLFMGPAILLLTVFAKNILLLWLGRDFAEKSTAIFQILAFGVLLSSLAVVPQNFLQGMGRPDITAKTYLFELAGYLGLAVLAIKHFGIVGAAVAWSLRAAIDFLLLLARAWKLSPKTLTALSEHRVFRSATALSCLCLAVIPVKLVFHSSIALQASLTSGLVVLFVVGAWQHALDTEDRISFMSVWGRALRFAFRAK